MKILKSLGLILLGALILPITLLANNFFNSSKVDYVVKEEINFKKADILTTKHSYINDTLDSFPEAKSYVGDSIANLCNSYLLLNDDTILIFVGSSTFTDDFRYSDLYTADNEFVYVLSRDRLVDVSFDNKTSNYINSPNCIVEHSNSIIFNSLNICDIMPMSIIEEFYGSEIDINDEDQMKDLESICEDLNYYCFTLSNFYQEIKSNYEDEELNQVKDHDLLQTMTLTFLHD